MSQRAITSRSGARSEHEWSIVQGLMNPLLMQSLVPRRTSAKPNGVSWRHQQMEAFLGVFVHSFIQLKRIGGTNKGNGVSGRHLMGALLSVHVGVHGFTLWRRT